MNLAKDGVDPASLMHTGSTVGMGNVKNAWLNVKLSGGL
jgi:hypothetical protein